MNSQSVIKEYINRINAVCDYIEKNINKSFTLDELTMVSNFSKYHFHRIFSAFMGETLYGYITRLKLERASGQLLYLAIKPVTQIALDYGFTDSAMFARAFKKHYGMSATEFREKNSNIGKDNKENFLYNHNENMIIRRSRKMNFKSTLEIKDASEMTVAYLRHVGTYEELGKVFIGMMSRLGAWAGAQGLISEDTKLLAVYHDNPSITEEDKLKTSICITIPKETKTEGDMGKMLISAGKYAIGHFEIDDENAAEQHGQAWEYMYGKWLPESGFQPDDKPVFEVYVNNPNMHPERKHLIDIYLPIKNA